MEPVILQPGEGERIGSGASTAVMKATAETTGGAFSISEATFPSGMNGPPPTRTDTQQTPSMFSKEPCT